MTDISTSGRRRDKGAYGLRLTGVGDMARHLVEAPPDWPELHIEREIGRPRIEADVAQEDWAEYRVLGGECSVRLVREPLTAHYTVSERFGDDAFTHPGLAMLASITARWLDRDAFHAGAFVTDGGAWGVLGAREAGKSTTLAHLAAKGVGITADDRLIIDRGRALAGPRCLDLRESAAEWLGTGTDIGVIGDRRRWRMSLAPVPAAVPFRGWIVPAWGDRVELTEAPPIQRLPLLYANLGLYQVPRDPRRFMRLAALPFLVLRRPQRWEAMDQAAAMLLDHTARCDPISRAAL